QPIVHLGSESLHPWNERDLLPVVALEPELLREHDRGDVRHEPRADDLTHRSRPRRRAHRLDVRLEVEAPLAPLPADPGMTATPERRAEFPHVEAVDPDRPRHE